MKKQNKKVRLCLKCDNNFSSSGEHICPSCRKENSKIEDIEWRYAVSEVDKEERYWEEKDI